MMAALDTRVARAGDEKYSRDSLRLGALYLELETAMDEAKGIKPNLDYPSGPAYHLIGFDTEIFTPLFVASRVTGWTAHVIEQLEANALIRPLSEYIGPDERHVPAS
jgi:citrate synthase/2-methylcitrate synthase